MTRKQFTALAAALREAKPAPNESTAAFTRWHKLVEEVKAICAAAFPSYNDERFTRAVYGAN